MKRLIQFGLVTVCLTGCTIVRQSTETKPVLTSNGWITATEMHSTVYTLFDGSSTVGNVKMSGGGLKPALIGVNAIDSQSSGSNSVLVLKEIGSILKSSQGLP